LRLFFKFGADLVESLLVFLACTLSVPVAVFRKIPNGHDVVSFGRVLSRAGLVPVYMRVILDSLLDNKEHASTLLEQIIGKLVADGELQKPDTKVVLIALYEKLAMVLLTTGEIEAAITVLIDAHKAAGVSSLDSFPGMSIQQAQIIKAGMTAGRLLEEEGFRDLVETGKPIIVRATSGKVQDTPSPEPEPERPGSFGKLLPFVRPETLPET